MTAVTAGTLLILFLPFLMSLGGQGGMPDECRPEQHAPRKLRVETLAGLVFGTLSNETPPLETYLGPRIVVNIRRGIVAPSSLIEVNEVEELRAIKADARTIEIGAAVTLAELSAHPQVIAHYPVLAQAAGIDAAPYVGYSMGGLIGLRFLAHFPDRVSRLALGGVGENYLTGPRVSDPERRASRAYNAPSAACDENTPVR